MMSIFLFSGPMVSVTMKCKMVILQVFLVFGFLLTTARSKHKNAMDHIFDTGLISGLKVSPVGSNFIPIAMILTNVNTPVNKTESSLFHHLEAMMTSLLENSAASSNLQMKVLTDSSSKPAIQVFPPSFELSSCLLVLLIPLPMLL